MIKEIKIFEWTCDGCDYKHLEYSVAKIIPKDWTKDYSNNNFKHYCPICSEKQK